MSAMEAHITFTSIAHQAPPNWTACLFMDMSTYSSFTGAPILSPGVWIDGEVCVKAAHNNVPDGEGGHYTEYVWERHQHFAGSAPEYVFWMVDPRQERQVVP